MSHTAPASLTLEFVPGNPRLAISRAGRGEVVLFLHGIGGNRKNWEGQLTCFSSAFQAVAWDMRGYGASDDYDGPFRFEDARSDIDRILDHLGVKACHLVGLSLGGRIAFDYTYHQPHRVLSLTACSAVPFNANMSPPVRRQFLASRQQPLLEGATPADIAPGVAASLAGPQCSELARQQLIDSLSALHTQSYLKMLEAVSAPMDAYPLGDIQVPTHIVAAEHDVLFPPVTLQDIARQMPQAHYSLLSSAGHLSNLEYPQAFNAVTYDFVRSIARPHLAGHSQPLPETPHVRTTGN